MIFPDSYSKITGRGGWGAVCWDFLNIGNSKRGKREFNHTSNDKYDDKVFLSYKEQVENPYEAFNLASFE